MDVVGAAVALSLLVTADSCPEGAELRQESSASWCADERGRPHGPVAFLRGDQPRLTGMFHEGQPTGEWTLWHDAEQEHVVSPVSSRVTASCGDAEPLCWRKAVERELRGLPRHGRSLSRPVFLRSGKGRALSYDDEGITVAFWSLFHLEDHPRQGWGLQQGRTTVYSREGRVRLSAEHDDEGRLHGPLLVADRHGIPERRATYARGWLSGDEKSYYAGSTQVRGVVSFAGGALDGRVEFFDDNGHQLVEGRFDQGQPCGLFFIRRHRLAEVLPECPVRPHDSKR